MKYPIIATVTAMLTLFFAALGQNAKPADPTPAEITKPAKLTEPAPLPIPDAAQKALYKAIHAHDQAQTQISTINSQFLLVQNDAKAKMDAAQKREQESLAAIAKAEDEVYKAAGVTRNDYAIDEEAMQLTPKTKPPAKAAPAPPPAPHQ